jgi:hypothetical protein
MYRSSSVSGNAPLSPQGGIMALKAVKLRGEVVADPQHSLSSELYGQHLPARAS